MKLNIWAPSNIFISSLDFKISQFSHLIQGLNDYGVDIAVGIGFHIGLVYVREHKVGHCPGLFHSG